MTGRFIAFEGGEAAGKSTQAARLADRLGAVLTREPGGTRTGEHIRSLVLDPRTGVLDARAEALLMAADRAHHVASVVRPAIEDDRHVVTDRYLYSSVAYQGHGRGLGAAQIRDLSLWATGDLEPDLVVFLDVAVDVARERVAESTPDRLESEDHDFHQRVRDGFREQAAADPERWLVLDGAVPVDELAAAIWRVVAPLVGEPSP